MSWNSSNLLILLNNSTVPNAAEALCKEDAAQTYIL